MFDQFCHHYLDLDNVSRHMDESKNLVTDFEYLITLLKTAFFWKKMRFETVRQ